jgi:predicted nucleotidyltransferase
MRSVVTVEELRLPYAYTGFLKHFLTKVSEVKDVSKVILFGSCVRGQIHDNSDIDLLVLTEDEIPLDKEFYIMNDCAPAFDNVNYIPSDIIVNSMQLFNKNKNIFGMVQKQAELEGIDLSGLL